MDIIDYTIITLFFQLLIYILHDNNIHKIYLLLLFDLILIYLLYEINKLYSNVIGLEKLILKFDYELKNTCPAVDIYENVKIYEYH